MISAIGFCVPIAVITAAVFLFQLLWFLPPSITQNKKSGFASFHFIFMGVNPFDSAALGRLIERAVDSGFMEIKIRNIIFESYS